LKAFVEHAQRQHGAKRLEDANKKDLRSFMDRAIAQGLAVKTLNRYRSALGCVSKSVEGIEVSLHKRHAEHPPERLS
jgi:hypothetical protein